MWDEFGGPKVIAAGFVWVINGETLVAVMPQYPISVRKRSSFEVVAVSVEEKESLETGTADITWIEMANTDSLIVFQYVFWWFRSAVLPFYLFHKLDAFEKVLNLSGFIGKSYLFINC